MKVLSASHVTQIIHIADIHVRVGNYESARVQEYKHVFDSFIEIIRQLPSVINGTALLVMCGDIFHSKCRMESAATQIFFDWINQLLELVPICIICGNHDFKQSEPDTTDSVEMLCTPYLKSYNRHKYTIHYLSHTGHYVWGNIGFGIVSVKDTLRAFNTAGIIDTLPSFPDPALFESSTEFKVALFHGTISQSALPSGKRADSISHGYPLMWFAGYDAVMLGDNHKQQLHEDTLNNVDMKWGYPGSLVQQDFGETVYGHGYILWDVASKNASMHHIPNTYGSITLLDEYVYTSPQSKYSFKDALLLPDFPMRPRVRIIGDRDDVNVYETLLKKYGIVPCEIILRSKLALVHRKTSASGDASGASGDASGDAYEVTNMGSSLQDELGQLNTLNSSAYWETYIQSTYVDASQAQVVTQWLNAPKNMMLPITYTIHESLVDSIKLRNTKLEKLFDAYNKHVHGINQNTCKISFKHMQWEYLMCYGEANYFDFTKITDKIALINGANATGKSAFLDVLCIAIYGEPTTMRRDFSGSAMSCKIINDHKPHGTTSGVCLHVEITEGLSTCTYEIQRSFVNFSTDEQSDSVKPNIIAVYKINDSCNIGDANDTNDANNSNESTQTKTIVAEGASMVDIWIAKYFGSIDEMLMSSILCQNDNVNFFTHKPVDQKLIIEKALHMDTISTFVAYLEECVKSHKYVLEKVHSYSQGMAQPAQSTHNAQNTIDSHNETTLLEMENQLAMYNKNMNELTLINTQALGIIQNLHEAQQLSSTNKLLREDLENKIMEYESTLQTLVEIVQDQDRDTLQKTHISLQLQIDTLVDALVDALVSTCSELRNIRDTPDKIDQLIGVYKDTLDKLSKENSVYSALYEGYSNKYTLEQVEEKTQQYYDWLENNKKYTDIHISNAIAESNSNNNELATLLRGYVVYEDKLTKPETLTANVEGVRNALDALDAPNALNVGDVSELYITYTSIAAQIAAHTTQKPQYNESVSVDQIPTILESYKEWIAQFPECWQETPHAQLKETLYQLKSTYNTLMNDSYVRKPTVLRCEEVNGINNKNKSSYTIELLETLQTPIYCEKDISLYDAWNTKWKLWCAFVKTVPSESVEEISGRITKLEVWIKKLEDACETLAQLQKNHDCITEEIKQIHAMEFNPECWACCKQPKMIRLQLLQNELYVIDKKIAKYQSHVDKYTNSVNAFSDELTELREKIKIKTKYEEQHSTYVAENASWTHALDASKREEKRTRKLTKVWWSLWDTWNSRVCNIQAQILLYESYIDSYVNMHETYTIALTNKDVATAFSTWSNTLDVLQEKQHSIHVQLWNHVKESIVYIHDEIAKNNVYIQQLHTYTSELTTWNACIDILQCTKMYHTIHNKYVNALEKYNQLISWNDLQSKYKSVSAHLDIFEQISTLRVSISKCKRILAYDTYTKNTRALEVLQQNIGKLTQETILYRDAYNRISAQSLQAQHVLHAYTDLKTRYEQLTEFYTHFVGTKTVDGFKNWVYKNTIIPLIEREMNAFIINIDTFSIKIRMKFGKLIFMLHDRGSTPTLDHASGYQKYIAGLAMRVALLRIGAVGKNIKHLILDEGFVACDSSNILKTKEIMELLMKIGAYKSIMMISHLETIRDIADVRIDVCRNANNITSYIRFGTAQKQIRKAGVVNDQNVSAGVGAGVGVNAQGVPKKKPGRPRKNV